MSEVGQQAPAWLQTSELIPHLNYTTFHAELWRCGMSACFMISHLKLKLRKIYSIYNRILGLSNKLQYFDFQYFYSNNAATNNIYYRSLTSSWMPLLAASKLVSHHLPSVRQKDKEEAFSSITAFSWTQTWPEMFVESDISHKQLKVKMVSERLKAGSRGE